MSFTKYAMKCTKKGAVSEMIFKIISVDGLFIFYSYIYMKLFLNEQVF